jgi:hypothetical protein
MIPPTIQLGFEPDDVTDPQLQAVIADPIAWAIWLLWRPCHIVSQHFNKNVLAAAADIRRLKPQTMRDYVRCFHGCDFPHKCVDDWISQAYPFLIGADKIRIEVKVKA